MHTARTLDSSGGSASAQRDQESHGVVVVILISVSPDFALAIQSGKLMINASWLAGTNL
jgi:hypothetical protein